MSSKRLTFSTVLKDSHRKTSTGEFMLKRLTLKRFTIERSAPVE